MIVDDVMPFDVFGYIEDSRPDELRITDGVFYIACEQQSERGETTLTLRKYKGPLASTRIGAGRVRGDGAAVISYFDPDNCGHQFTIHASDGQTVESLGYTYLGRLTDWLQERWRRL